jgi:sigma-B regulation protein RsbU (phosphoserine phosphatase)
VVKKSQSNLQRANQAMQRELEIGRQIQASFLPKTLPQPPGWEIAACFEAARMVAGDFYDAFPLSGAKRVGLVIGDVCDKGVGAALFMALFRSLIRAFAEQHYSLSWMDVLSNDALMPARNGSLERRRTLLTTGTTALKNAIEHTNNYIVQNHGDTSMFATVFCGVLDPANGALVYINAGHVPAAVINASGVKRRLEPTGPALGLLPDMDFSIEQVDLEADDILFLFTDGVTDARGPDEAFFTEERLLSLVTRPVQSAEAMLELIRSNLRDHIGDAVQYDDITMLAVKRNPISLK